MWLHCNLFYNTVALFVQRDGDRKLPINNSIHYITQALLFNPPITGFWTNVSGCKHEYLYNWLTDNRLICYS